jgi:hypothetical protein
MLNTDEEIKSIFKQSEENDEGITSVSKKKNRKIIIPGSAFMPLSRDVGDESYYNREESSYAFLNAHSAILPLVQLESGMVLETLRIDTDGGVNGYYCYAYDDTTWENILINVSPNPTHKINKIVTEGQKIWIETAATNQIKKVIIEISQ